MKRALRVTTVSVALTAASFALAPGTALADRFHAHRGSGIARGHPAVAPRPFHHHVVVTPRPFVLHARPFVVHRPFVPFVAAAPIVVYSSPPAYYVAPTYDVPPVYYAPPRTSDPPPISGQPANGTVSVAPLPTPNVVQYPHGRYELRGDGVSVPYRWVWIPNPPPPPPAAPPPS